MDDTIEYTYKFIRIKDGEERWACGTGRHERDENGQRVRLVGTVQDITGQKRTEDKLVASGTKAEVDDRKHIGCNTDFR